MRVLGRCMQSAQEIEINKECGQLQVCWLQVPSLSTKSGVALQEERERENTKSDNDILKKDNKRHKQIGRQTETEICTDIMRNRDDTEIL